MPHTRCFVAAFHTELRVLAIRRLVRRGFGVPRFRAMAMASRRPWQSAAGGARALSLAGLVACGALLSLVGCSRTGQLQHAIGRYELGHYKATASACTDLHDEAAGMNDKARVRYLVYCGLAHYKLGHVHEARAMLAQGSQTYLDGSLGWLKPDVVDELLKALDELEGAPRAVDTSTIARSTATTR
jgi:hypothetical protein